MVLQIAHNLIGGKRPDIGAVVHRITHHQRVRPFDEAPLEIAADRIRDDCTSS